MGAVRAQNAGEAHFRLGRVGPSNQFYPSFGIRKRMIHQPRRARHRYGLPVELLDLDLAYALAPGTPGELEQEQDQE